MIRKTLLMTALALGLTQGLFAASDQNVAVMDFETNGISKMEGKTLTDFFRQALFKTQRFVIMERNQLNVILQEQNLQQTDCVETACAVEIGRMAAVDLMFVGSISKLGTRFIIECRMIDVGSGSIRHMETAECSDCGIENLPEKMTELANAIAGEFKARGRVTQVEGDKVYIDMGSVHGLKVGDLVEAYKMETVTDKRGKVIMKKKSDPALIRLESVTEKASEGMLVKGAVRKNFTIAMHQGGKSRLWWWIGGGAAVAAGVASAVILTRDPGEEKPDLPTPPGTPAVKR